MAELDARTRGPEAAPPAGAVREAADPVARFHALCALALAEQPQEALDMHLAAAPNCPSICAGGCARGRPTVRSSWATQETPFICTARRRIWPGGLDRAIMLQEQAALLI